jgi:transposase
MTTLSQWVREAPGIHPAAHRRSDSIHSRFHREAELGSASLTRAAFDYRGGVHLMTEPALGIDIAKLKFNVCLIQQSGKLKHKLFPNNATGFEQLREWLSRQGIRQVYACLEATGTYGEALALFLHEAGHSVSIINPAAVKAFAQSRLSRTKTDRVDAALIARFCQAQAPPAWRPLPAEVRELQALVRRLESLQEMRVMEENRLSSGITVEVVRESVEELLAYLNEQIKRTEELIGTPINSHPTLKQQSELLDSIPGIAETTAALLLSEITDITP